MPLIDISDFAKKHSTRQSGNSFTTLDNIDLIDLVETNWHKRIPGNGEVGIDRKVLVPVPNFEFFCPSTIKLQSDMIVKSKIFTRQNGEDPYILNYVELNEAFLWGFKLIPAINVNVVCYSDYALLENNGTRSSSAQWEIVTILCDEGKIEPMAPLTMARNFLEMPGGSKGVYSAIEFAEAIYYHSKKNVSVIDESYFES